MSIASQLFPQRAVFVAAIFASVTLSLTAPRTFAVGAEVVPVITSDQFVLNGEIVTRTDVSLTLVTRDSQSTTVQVNDTTTITKGAQTIRLSEIMVGDKVSVTVMRAADGKLQAVAVSVRTGFE